LRQGGRIEAPGSSLAASPALLKPAEEGVKGDQSTAVIGAAKERGTGKPPGGSSRRPAELGVREREGATERDQRGNREESVGTPKVRKGALRSPLVSIKGAGGISEGRGKQESPQIPCGGSPQGGRKCQV